LATRVFLLAFFVLIAWMVRRTLKAKDRSLV
jgi:hypothetical protein